MGTKERERNRDAARLGGKRCGNVGVERLKAIGPKIVLTSGESASPDRLGGFGDMVPRCEKVNEILRRRGWPGIS
jgi:hypothetical protein